jgi:hypothetical protein
LSDDERRIGMDWVRGEIESGLVNKDSTKDPLFAAYLSMRLKEGQGRVASLRCLEKAAAEDRLEFYRYMIQNPTDQGDIEFFFGESEKMVARLKLLTEPGSK